MKKEMTFETASEETTTLQRSLELYSKAAELVAFCSQTLENAQLKIDEISEKLQVVVPPQE